MRIRSSTVCALLLMLTTIARADMIYSFTGVGTFAGTNFSIDSPSLLTYGANSVPVTTSSVIYVLGFPATILYASFFTNQDIDITTYRSVSPIFVGDATHTYDIGANGTYTDSRGNILTISSAPTVVTMTPEPTSFALLGSGLLATGGIVLRKDRTCGKPRVHAAVLTV